MKGVHALAAGSVLALAELGSTVEPPAPAKNPEVELLGSDSYRTREEVTKLLRDKMNCMMVADLEKALRSPDREIATRASHLLEPVYDQYVSKLLQAIKADRLKSGLSVLPWISSLPGECDQDAQENLNSARVIRGIQGPPEWLDYRDATELKLKKTLHGMRPASVYQEALSQKRTVEQHLDEKMRKRVNAYQEAENTWIANFGQRYSPPITVPVAPAINVQPQPPINPKHVPAPQNLQPAEGPRSSLHIATPDEVTALLRQRYLDVPTAA